MKRIFLTLTLALFVIPFGISQDLPSYVPTDGLLAYYPFNGNANDESGNTYHGTVNGATLTSDRYGNENSSYSFDGVDDYIVLFENGEINFDATDSFSYSLWFKQGASTENSYGNINGTVLASKNDSRNGTNITVGYSNKTVTFFIEGDQNLNNSVASSSVLNHWVYLSFVYDSSSQTLKAFNNGSKVDELITESLVGDLLSNSMWIGRRTNYTPLDTYVVGSIDDIGIWNRVLTEQEIQNLYTSSDILLNGVVSAENNQIRNVADPSHGKDAVTKDYLLEKIALLQDQIDALQSTSGSGAVTDQDGNSYPYLTYGDQVWTVKNAEIVTYRDGTPIPQVTDATEWANLTTGAWCYYDNDPNKGKLYNWYAVAGIHDNDENTPNKELAPEGWHVPTDAEWTELENYLIANGYNYDGTTTGNKIAKAMSSTTGWNDSTSDGAPGNNQLNNNSSGFNAHPKGILSTDPNYFFVPNGNSTFFWSSSSYNSDYAKSIYLGNISETLPGGGTNLKTGGCSVRFVRD